MSFTLTTSGAAILKAGLNAPAISTSGAALKVFVDMAEHSFCALTRKDWITDYANVDANMKEAISDAVSSLAGMNVIAYDMNSYANNTEAQTMLDFARDTALRIIDKLKEDANKTFPTA